MAAIVRVTRTCELRFAAGFVCGLLLTLFAAH